MDAIQAQPRESLRIAQGWFFRLLERGSCAGDEALAIVLEDLREASGERALNNFSECDVWEKIGLASHSLPMHSHAQTEIMLIEVGLVSAVVQNRKTGEVQAFAMREGDSILIPSGDPHFISAAKDTRARVWFAPPLSADPEPAPIYSGVA